MARVTVSIGGLKELQSSIKRLPKKLATEIDAEIEVALNEAVGLAKRDAPSNEANLIRGINAKKEKSLNWTFNSNAYYSVFMEFGTKSKYQPIPGVDPSEFKADGTGKSGKGFYDSILDWVKRKKITGTYSVKSQRRVGSKTDQQIEDEQTAFAIYLSIIRHGVKPHPFFFKQVDKVGPKLISNIQNVLNGQHF
jgi:hypothetical protein